MPLDLALDLAHALDPVGFVQDRLKLEPDPWQARLLRSRAPWILLNCCRQSGKSTTTAAVALHTAIYDPGLILLVSPSLRQSKELFAKVTGFLKDLEPAEVLAGSTSAALARSPAPGQEARADDRVQPQLGLTRFGGHPESLARGAADAKNTTTVFAGVSPTDGRPRPCWT